MGSFFDGRDELEKVQVDDVYMSTGPVRAGYLDKVDAFEIGINRWELIDHLKSINTN